MPTETNHVPTKTTIRPMSNIARQRKIVKAEMCRRKCVREDVLWCLGVAGDAWLQRAGAERFWSLCSPSAAELEAIAAVVVTVITVLAVITGIPRYGNRGSRLL